MATVTGPLISSVLVLAAATGIFRVGREQGCSTPVVTTRLGQLCGSLYKAPTGYQYLAFRGIPYAKPPLGKLRFMPPQPADPWSGVVAATSEGPSCWQSGQGALLGALAPSFRQGFLLLRALPSLVRTFTTRSRQDENCLFLNVYTRSLTGRKPVMVWIHGGGFHAGSGGAELYGPEYLLGEDVILVTFNYRLGPLGFLSLPGLTANAGLKDQSAALRWVRDNIAAFGGDPNRVTIFGESAGGTSVQMHLLSPLSRGLFSGAISQSGSALNPRSVSTQGRERAYRLADLVGVRAGSDAELLQRLQALTPERITANSEEALEDNRGLATHPFVPAPESPSDPGAFLPGKPIELINKAPAGSGIAPVPYITGINSLEAGFMLNGYGRDVSLDTLESLVPGDLAVPPRSQESFDVTAKMKRAYAYPGDTLSDSQLARMYSDLFVGLVVQRALRLHSRLGAAPVYAYYFTYDGNLAPSHRVLDKKLKGVNHGDEMGYLFPMEMLPTAYERPIDKLARERLVKLWTNFARTGNPNIEGSPLLTTQWPTANNDSRLFLEIGNDLIVKKGHLLSHMPFWDTLYSVREGGSTR